MVKYVLTGTTGGLGSKVLKHTLNIVPPSDLIISLYNPKGATADITDSGVEVRQGNFEEPSSLDTAFAGADKLLIVSYPSIAHEIRVKSHKAAIDAAKRVGIKHIYYTSLAFGSNSKAAVMQAHIDTEAYLKDSGITYTIIREGIYSESFPLYLGFWDPTEYSDNVVIPHSDGPIAWVNRDDLGEGTAKIITADSGYENETVLLSGSQAITLTSLAEKITTVLPSNRNVTVNIVSEDEYVSHLSYKQGEGLLRPWSTTYSALGVGELGTIDPLLKKLLGREPVPMIETLKDMLLGLGADSNETTKQYAK